MYFVDTGYILDYHVRDVDNLFFCPRQEVFPRKRLTFNSGLAKMEKIEIEFESDRITAVQRS